MVDRMTGTSSAELPSHHDGSRATEEHGIGEDWRSLEAGMQNPNYSAFLRLPLFFRVLPWPLKSPEAINSSMARSLNAEIHLPCLSVFVRAPLKLLPSLVD